MRDEASEEFWSSFSSGGGLVRTCQCGITHFVDDERAGDWNDGELEELRKRAEDTPEKCIGHVDIDAISSIELAGSVVWGCNCGLAKKYENFLIQWREEILTYFSKKLKLLTEEQKQLEQQLKDASK